MRIIGQSVGHIWVCLLFQVDSRPTARIPIVMFKDLESGLKCDISVMNRLALRNTLLLKVDFIVCSVVKRDNERQLNSLLFEC